MRGKLAAVIKELGTVGLIPAYAGKTRFRVASIDKLGAHPRVCGENADGDDAGRVIPGSSPRMRGKLGLFCFKKVYLGLIPAYAGKTQTFALQTFGPGAHPRVCGENFCEFDSG